MNRPGLLGGCLAAFVAFASAQEPLPIPFLATQPRMDGLPGPVIEALPSFPLEGARSGVRARFAYGEDFLYVSVDSPQETVQCRDRAYQNGDGLILVVAEGRPGASVSNHFRVLGFSPQPPEKRTWQHAFTWYQDRELSLMELPDATFTWSLGTGIARFEITVPWSRLGVHPWLNADLGINVCYVHAMDGKATADSFLVPDEDMQGEDQPRRFRPVAFVMPGSDSVWTAALDRGHWAAGQSTKLKVAGAGAMELSVRVVTGEGEKVLTRDLRFEPGPAQAIRELPLDLEGLPPGGYQAEIQGSGHRLLRQGFTVLPLGDLAPLATELARMRLPSSTRATLDFRLEDLRRRLDALRPESTGGLLRIDLDALLEDFQDLRRGKDPIATKPGLQRRAYRSALDGTLQPYSIRVPTHIEKGRTYPLLVYLHGSGRDDRGQLDHPAAPADWFQLAPKGRGIHNCFSADHAQDDLREAIQDVIRNYQVDPGRIFLAGFSMGGYGAYRTAFERPGFFRGIGVFSGAPDLATRWIGPGHPDFLVPANLACFKGQDFFIFHGTADTNCPYDKTLQVVDLLRAAGAYVEFAVEQGKGHDRPSPATEARYHAWLKGLAAH